VIKHQPFIAYGIGLAGTGIKTLISPASARGKNMIEVKLAASSEGRKINAVSSANEAPSASRPSVLYRCDVAIITGGIEKMTPNDVMTIELNCVGPESVYRPIRQTMDERTTVDRESRQMTSLQVSVLMRVKWCAVKRVFMER
jgi:hypothetical protein